MRIVPSPTQLLSQVYNTIRVPSSSPKCWNCNNDKFCSEEEFAKKFISPIEEIHVDVFVCNFCQNISKPCCERCFSEVQCCKHKQKIKYQQFFSEVKQKIVKQISSIHSQVSHYSQISENDIQPQFFSSTSELYNSVFNVFSKVKAQFESQVESKLESNQKQLIQMYRGFQQTIIETLLHQFNQESVGGLSESLSILKSLQRQKTKLETYGEDECKKYVDEIGKSYCGKLFVRLENSLRQFLAPRKTLKDATSQASWIDSSLYPTESPQKAQSKINQRDSQQPSSSDVETLQRKIQQNQKLVEKLRVKLKDWEFVVQRYHLCLTQSLKNFEKYENEDKQRNQSETKTPKDENSLLISNQSEKLENIFLSSKDHYKETPNVMKLFLKHSILTSQDERQRVLQIVRNVEGKIASSKHTKN